MNTTRTTKNTESPKPMASLMKFTAGDTLHPWLGFLRVEQVLVGTHV